MSEKLFPCKICGNPPGQKVGPPALARCIDPDCKGSKLRAVTLAEWNDRSRPPPTPEYVRSISEQVYRVRLAESAGGNDAEWRAAEADRMIEKDGDGGKKFSGRAGQFDPLTRVYIDVLGIKPLDLTDSEIEAACDGTILWNYDDPNGRFHRGDPIGVTEMLRRKRGLISEGIIKP